jgi:Trypsin
MAVAHAYYPVREFRRKRMRTCTLGPILAFVSLGLQEGACNGDGAAPVAPIVSSAAQEIQGGQIDTGDPAVGAIFAQGGAVDASHLCSGTLIAPSYVLTAKHCMMMITDMTFSTGPAFPFLPSTMRHVDQMIAHPTLDLLILHLASPILDIVPVPVPDSVTPALGEVCTTVGYGTHNTTDLNSDLGTKRSATGAVNSVSTSKIVVGVGTGVADSGDSGGPLFCSKGLVAVVSDHIDDPNIWSHRTHENYAPIDAAWVAGNAFQETSPAIAIGQNGPVMAFSAGGTHHLWIVGTDGVGHEFNPPLTLAPGTSPAIAIATGQSDPVIALQVADTHHLWIVGANGVAHEVNPTLTLAPGTSPAIAMDGSNPVIALNGADTNYLWLVDSNGNGHPTSPVLQMTVGTSPAIAMGSGGPVIAFQAGGTHHLWIVGTDGVGHEVNPTLTLAPGTSPAMAMSSTGPVIALNGADTNYLWVVDSNGNGHPTTPVLQLTVSTTPAIAMGSGGPVIAFHAGGTHHLWTVGTDGVGHEVNPPLTLAPGTSPAIAIRTSAPALGPLIALHGADTDFLWQVAADGSGHAIPPGLQLASALDDIGRKVSAAAQLVTAVLVHRDVRIPNTRPRAG